MNIALRRAMTVEEFLAWAGSREERTRAELINGQIVFMAPERLKHIEAKFAAVLALKNAIARSGLPCHALGDGVTVRIDEHTVYEPDGLVYCGTKLPGDSLIVPNPIIIVEVLSPTTVHTDTSAKLIGYFKIPSVRHYLIVDPDAHAVTHHTSGSNRPAAAGLKSGKLHLDPPGLEIEIAELLGLDATS